jgi:serine/threonine-protein kinase HipA
MFLDSSPDRWGRMLMRRRESILARKNKKAPRDLFESNYLLGVYDQQRIGGLRFKLEKNGAFLNDNNELATPPWTTLKELEYAAFQIENTENINDTECLKWLNLLMFP